MPTIDDLRTLLRAAWGPNTSYPYSAADWDPDHILGEVHLNGAKTGHHYWSRLPDGNVPNCREPRVWTVDESAYERSVTRPDDSRHLEDKESWPTRSAQPTGATGVVGPLCRVRIVNDSGEQAVTLRPMHESDLDALFRSGSTHTWRG